MSHSSDWVNLYDMTAHYVAIVMKHWSSDVATVGRRPGRKRGAEEVRTGMRAKCSSAPNDCASPSGGVSCGAGEKPRSECLRGDVQLRLRPSKERAARSRKRRFEAGCGGWVRRKGGRAVE